MLWSNALPTVLKDFGEKTQERATVNVPQNDNKGGKYKTIQFVI